MASLVTLQNLQALVLFPTAGAAAGASLAAGATPIASLTATEIGTWANAMQWTVTHGLLLDWSLQLDVIGLEQTFSGLDTSIGVDNTGTVQPATTYGGQPVTQAALVTIAKLADGRPDATSGVLTAGQNAQSGLDLSVLAKSADALVGAEPNTFYARNPLVRPFTDSYLSSLNPEDPPVWADLDATARTTFLTALLAAISD